MAIKENDFTGLINAITEYKKTKTNTDFNFFEILGIERKETIHSKFLALLFDPNGCHNQGSLFLENFLKTIGITETIAEGNKVKVETEKIAKFIHDPEFKKGGNIDITITDAIKKPIFIENKIYAGDQPLQLLRYHHSSPNALLIYLTLDGKEPKDSTRGTKEQFLKILPNNSYNEYKDAIRCISYKKEILTWLESCQEELSRKNLSWEPLNQYLEVVKEIIGQTRSKKMEKELIEIVTKDVNTLSSYFAIRNINIDEITKTIVMEKAIPMLEKIANERNLKFEITSEGDINDCFSYAWGFAFSKPEWENKAICFLFDSNLLDLRYSICDPTRKHNFEKMDYYQDWRNNADVLVQFLSENNDVIKTIAKKLDKCIDEIKEQK